MENAARTMRFLSLMEERKATLRSSLSEIFPNSLRFVCEFGCGHGHFLAAYALAHPLALCVGLDIESARIERAEKKQARAQTTNLHFLHAEANLFIDLLPPSVMFSDVFILFPDPWPKKRHHKHRLIQPEFLEKIRSRASETTRIFFRTDFDAYFEEARATIDHHPGWKLVDEAWPFEHETVFQSRAASYQSLVARLRIPRP